MNLVDESIGRRTALTFVALAAWLALLAIITPLNHDENQYVAAAALSVKLRPFVDFLYLQTPLQPALFRPFVDLVPGANFIVLRLANVLCGVTTLALVFAAQRRLGTPSRTALVATLALAGSSAFLFTSSVARNDAMPATLLAAAAVAAIKTSSPLRWSAAGLLLGLAASTKISFAFPAAALGLWLAWTVLRNRLPWPVLAGYTLGGIIGVLPILLAWHSAPSPFEYGVWSFQREGVFDWYRQNGLDGRLTQSAKLIWVPWFLALGPALAALMLLGWRFRCLPATATPVLALLVGGIIGAVLPTPVWKQYLMTALPPLFILTGTVLAGLPPPHQRRAHGLLLVLAGASAIGHGIAGGLDWARRGQPAALRVAREAHWIGKTLDSHGIPATGIVATFSPILIVDSGHALDIRFATGVAVIRSADRHTDADLAAWHTLGWRTLDAQFAARPPCAIVTGYEGVSTLNRRRFPDAALDGWAHNHGYIAIASPVDKATLWIAPACNDINAAPKVP